MKITGIMKTLILGLVLVGAVSFSNDVRAGLVPSLQPGSPTAGSLPGQFTFSYDVTLGSDQKINTGAVPTESVITSTGTPGTNFASFFTVYDFGGFVPGSNLQPTGWSFLSLVSNLGATPNTTLPFDSAGVSNLTWFWTDGPGSVLPAPGSLVGTFAAQSTIGNLAVLHDFTSGATRNTPSDPLTNNTALGTIGTVVAPGPGQPPPPNGVVPEPATLLLLGSGLAGLAGWRQWRAKKD